MILYIRCAIYNRATLLGIVMFLIILCLGPIVESNNALSEMAETGLTISLLLIMATRFGYDTFVAYCRYRDAPADSRKEGSASRYRRNLLASVYCTRRGAELAEKDLERETQRGR
jgi:hypothetical protein